MLCIAVKLGIFNTGFCGESLAFWASLKCPLQELRFLARLVTGCLLDTSLKCKHPLLWAVMFFLLLLFSFSDIPKKRTQWWLTLPLKQLCKFFWFCQTWSIWFHMFFCLHSQVCIMSQRSCPCLPIKAEYYGSPVCFRVKFILDKMTINIFHIWHSVCFTF